MNQDVWFPSPLQEAEDKEAPSDPAPPAEEPVGVDVAREHLPPPLHPTSPPNPASALVRKAAANREDRERAVERGRGGGEDDRTGAKRGEEEWRNYGEQTTLTAGLMSKRQARGPFRRAVERELNGRSEGCEDWRRMESTPLLSVQKRRGTEDMRAQRNRTEETHLMVVTTHWNAYQ